MLYLSQEDVLLAGGMNIERFLEAVEDTFRLKQAGAVASPKKVEMTWPDSDRPVEQAGRAMAMPAYVGGRFDVAGVKWIPSVPSNPAVRSLPRANAVILLSSRETGLPVAVMDGTVISAMRTAAVTGLVARLCATSTATTAAIIGAGPIAKTQLLGLRAGSPQLENLLIFDLDEGRAANLAQQATAEGWTARTARDSDEAVRAADVLVTATTSAVPSFRPDGLKAGATVCLVSRLDAPLQLHRMTDRLIVDDWEHESQHTGRYVNRLLTAGLISGQDDVLELGAIITGEVNARASDGDRVVASMVGLGIEDVASAKMILDHAQELDLGTPIPLREGAPAWV